MISEWLLKETNQRRLKETMPEVAIIPTSAIEPHNLHLPIGQDFMHTGIVVERSAKKAWGNTKKVIALPGIPYGVDCNLLDFPIAIHVSQNSLNNMLRDIITSLRHYGIRKIVLVNGHGGNDFTPFVRQIQHDLDVFVFQMDWWKVGDDKYFDVFEKAEDHAGEMETSIGLALYPHLVELEHAKDGKSKSYRFKALQEGWIRTSRDFGKLNDHCATADPYAGTAEKGEKFLNIVVDRIAVFLTELANEPIDDSFPYSNK